jgi:hypothetical protein
MSRPIKNRTGIRYGALVAQKPVRRRSGKGHNAWWRCKCDCGNLVERDGGDLGPTSSCGCVGRAKRVARLTIHGMYGSRENVSYRRMLDRCYNKNHEHYDRYGGRGIVVCVRWRRSFAAFFRDMGPRPAKMSLSRKDNDGNYCKRNCVWATATEQNRNRSNTRWITAFGKTKTAAEWAESRKLNLTTVLARISAGDVGEVCLRPSQRVNHG